jgi:hypothetical protein
MEAQTILHPPEKVLHAFKDLQPPEPLLQCPCQVLIVAISKATLAKVLKAVPLGSAAGPSGWTYEHMKATSRSRKDSQAAVLGLVLAVAQADLPRLLDDRVIPFAQPSGGICPTVIRKF